MSSDRQGSKRAVLRNKPLKRARLFGHVSNCGFIGLTCGLHMTTDIDLVSQRGFIMNSKNSLLKFQDSSPINYISHFMRNYAFRYSAVCEFMSL